MLRLRGAAAALAPLCGAGAQAPDGARVSLFLVGMGGSSFLITWI